MLAYTRETDFDECVTAKEQFEKMLSELRSESTPTLEHGDVESLIAREGNELLRRLLQGYWDHRAPAEEPLERVVGGDGPERRHCRARSRTLTTLFGEVTVRRLGYRAVEWESVFPLDEALTLPPDQ